MWVVPSVVLKYSLASFSEVPLFPLITKVPSCLTSPLPSSNSKSTTSVLNFTVDVLPLSTLPLWSSDTLKVAVCFPNGASAATFPVTVAVPGLFSTAPVFVRVVPLLKLTPLGNPLSYFKFTFPLGSLSNIDNGTFKVAPL